MKAMLREGENIYHSHMHMSRSLSNSSISIFSRNEKKVLYTNAIPLLQMQECPQSNIKQEIKSFCFKNFTKSDNELSLKKKTQTKSFLLKRTIQKKYDLSLNNSKENTRFVIERHSKQETDPLKPNKAKVAKNNSKDVKQIVNRSI
jgi:hypothetical protein